MIAPIEKCDGAMPSGAMTTDCLPSRGLDLAAGSGLKIRLADYCELAKVRLSLLVLFVTAVGYCLGTSGSVHFAGMLHVLLGTALVAFAANALNQVMERDLDRRMRRTADRPLPSGRMSQAEALAFGITAASVGVAYLVIVVNLLAAVLAALTLLLYLVAYTPLKRRTPLNTLVGAIPGAIPTLIGFAAAAGTLAGPAWVLFAILFLWQIPHFYAIAWLYRDDYARAGYRMISLADPTGRVIGRQTLLFTTLLLITSVVPAQIGMTGNHLMIGATLLGFVLLLIAGRFAAAPTRLSARFLMLASVVYLPLLLLLILSNRLP